MYIRGWEDSWGGAKAAMMEKKLKMTPKKRNK